MILKRLLFNKAFYFLILMTLAMGPLASAKNNTPIQVDVPKATCWYALGQLFRGDFKFANYKNRKRTYEDAVSDRQEAIDAAGPAKEEITAKVSKITASEKTAKVQDLADQYVSWIANAKTSEKVDDYVAEFKEKADAELARAHSLRIHTEGYDAINSLHNELSRKERTAVLNPLHEEFTNKVKQLNSESEIKAATAEYKEKANAEYLRAKTVREEKEIARIKKEKRFDVKVPGNSASILQAYVELASPSPEISKSFDHAQLAVAMDHDSSLKEFIYREMQVLRRMKLSPVPKDSNGINARTQNNFKVISLYLDPTGPDHQTKLISLTMGTRKALLLTRQSRFFGKLIPKNSMRRLTGAQREQVIADTLKIPELSLSIMGSVVTIPTLPKRPVKPIKPVKPELYQISRNMSKYSRQQYKVENQRRKIHFQQQKIQFVRDVETFEKDRVIYLQTVAKAKEVDARRLAARQTLLSYMAQTFPESFAITKNEKGETVRVSSLVVAAQRKLIEKRKLQMSAEKLAQLERELDRLKQVNRDIVYQRNTTITQTQVVTTNSYAYDDSFDWAMMFYTGNPMWIISPTYARAQLFVDLAFGHDRSDVQYNFNQSMSYYDSGLNEPLHQVQDNVDQFIATNPSVVTDVNNQMSIADPENTYNLSAVANDVSATNDPVAAADGQVDVSMGLDAADATAVDPNFAVSLNGDDADWASFKEGSDAGWSKDDGTGDAQQDDTPDDAIDNDDSSDDVQS